MKRKDEQQGRRPPTTAKNPKDNASGWATFWRVERLTRLSPEATWEIRQLNNYRSGDARRNAPPRGPERIELPFGIVLPEPPSIGVEY